MEPTEVVSTENQFKTEDHPQSGSLAEACEEARALLTTYSNVARAVADGYFLDAKKHLGKEKSITPKLVSALKKLSEMASVLEVESIVQERARHEQLHYRENLEGRFNAAGITFAGVFPDYLVREVINLQIDLQKGNSMLDGKRLGTLEPMRIVEQTEKRIRELLDRPFAGDAFLNSILSAYGEVLSSQGKGYGEYADIKSIAKSVGEKLKGVGQDTNYSEEKFAVDIYRLCASGRPVTPDGAVLEFSPAQSAGGGLYIPAKAGGNYIAALRFFKGNDNA